MRAAAKSKSALPPICWPARSFTNPAPSKVRFVRARYVGLFSRIPIAVFGTHKFGPVRRAVSILSIRHRRLPRRGEDVLVLDRELELQNLAGSVRIRVAGIVVLFCVPVES